MFRGIIFLGILWAQVCVGDRPLIADCVHFVETQSFKDRLTMIFTPRGGPYEELDKVFPTLRTLGPLRRVMIFFNGERVSLVVGPYLFDYGPRGWRVRKDWLTVGFGYAVHLEVGQEKYQAMIQSIENKSYESLSWGSNVVKVLTFLQRHGVFIKGNVCFSWMALLTNSLQQGFVDEQGKEIEQVVWEVYSSRELKPHSSFIKRMRKWHIQRFSDLLAEHGFSRNDLRSELQRVTYDRELISIADENLVSPNEKQEKFILTLLMRTEENLAKQIKYEFGETRTALELAATTGIPTAMSREAIRAAMRKTFEQLKMKPLFVDLEDAA